VLTLGLILEEAIDLGHGAVEGHDSEAVISSIEDEVLSHDSKANEAEVTAVNRLVLLSNDCGSTGSASGIRNIFRALRGLL
jgi:hypothetical protein